MYNRWIKWLAHWMTSPSFVGFFFCLIGFWITFNVVSLWKFDPPPFMALNLVMSALAGVQATAVAVAERDRRAKDQKRDEYMLHMMEAMAAMLKSQIDRQQRGGEGGEEGPD